MNNTDLRVAGVNMLVVDWNYVANPATRRSVLFMYGTGDATQ